MARRPPNPFDSEVLALADVMAANTGHKRHDQAWLETVNAEERDLRHSIRLAELLEAAGHKMVVGQPLTLVGTVTGVVQQVPALRATRFLPFVARRERGRLALELEYLLARDGSGRSLFAATVVSKGPVTAGELRERAQDLHRRVSKLAHLLRDLGFDLLLRATEYPLSGSKTVERGGVEPPTYHLHAHLLLFGPKRRDAVEQLAPLLRHHFPCPHVEAVKNAAEAIQYALKPPFTDGRLPQTAAQASALFEALQGLKLVQPMGALAELREDFRERQVRIVRIEPDGELVQVGGLVLNSKPSDAFARDAVPCRHNNQVVGLTLPSGKVTPWREPYVVVRNYDETTFDLDAALAAHGGVIRFRRLWAENGAPDPMRAVQYAKALLANCRNSPRHPTQFRNAARHDDTRSSPIAQLSAGLSGDPSTRRPMRGEQGAGVDLGAAYYRGEPDIRDGPSRCSSRIDTWSARASSPAHTWGVA